MGRLLKIIKDVIFGHECCFCDKIYDHTNAEGLRTIAMACNKCEEIEVHTIQTDNKKVEGKLI